MKKKKKKMAKKTSPPRMPRHPLTSRPVVLLAGRTGSIVVVSDAEGIVLFSNSTLR